MKLRPCRLGTALAGIFTVVGAMSLFGAANAQATVSPTPITIGMTAAAWNTVVNIPQFDPVLGQLTQVQVTVAWNGTQQIQVLNYDGQDGFGTPADTQYIYGDNPLAFALTLPDSSVINAGPADQTIGSYFQSPFAPYQMIPTFPVDPNTTLDTGLLSTSGSASSTLSGASVASFIGTGSVALPAVCSHQGSSLADGGSLIWNISANFGVTVSVVYTYTLTTTGTNSGGRTRKK